jgi:hypothetical protein
MYSAFPWPVTGHATVIGCACHRCTESVISFDVDQRKTAGRSEFHHFWLLARGAKKLLLKEWDSAQLAPEFAAL